MPISMNPSAQYVTLQGFYSGNVVGKPLSDRRIAFYQRQGRYDPTYRPPKKLSKREKTLQQLLDIFV